MYSIIKKEFDSFFSSAIGYLVIAVFFILTGLFLWVFKGDFNLFDYGFADVSPLFMLLPWVFAFLIPAVCMRSISEEKKQTTIELLLSMPLRARDIILGKFFGTYFIIIITLLPSLLYVFTLYKLGNPEGNIDLGSVMTSYFGVLLLAAAFTAISVFFSAITENQIVAFVLAVFVSVFFYAGFSGVASLSDGLFGVTQFGAETHFESMTRGLVDTRDVMYFLLLSFVFLGLATIAIRPNKIPKQIAILLIIPLLGGLASENIYTRLDLTKDQRYTLSEVALQSLENADKPIIVDVLLAGKIPPAFKKLQSETKQVLEEFATKSNKLYFNFIDPLEDEYEQYSQQTISQLQQMGIKPVRATTSENGVVSQQLFFPWAIASLQEKSVSIPLLKSSLGDNQEQRIQKSIQNIEYAFADGFSKLTNTNRKKIAVLRSHQTLPQGNIADFLRTLKEYYQIAPFSLKKANSETKKALESLINFDLLIVPKPLQAFSETEKQVLDQYLMNGGKTLWLVDAVTIEMDSLFNQKSSTVALAKNLNLNDLFFKYGIRINPTLVKDLYHAPIVIASGKGNQSQYRSVPWPYNPLAIQQKTKHPISKNLSAVWFRFASSIDTVNVPVKKTILLNSSAASKVSRTPRQVSLKEINQKPDYKNAKGHYPLAVLLEGSFTSVYKNRVLPTTAIAHTNQSIPTKMIVAADGDLIKNQLDNQGNPLELGYDKWTNNFYENKQFLLNCVNYLLDDKGLMSLRTKDISVAFLDSKKIIEQKKYWQFFNLGLPLVVLLIFGSLHFFLRRLRYIKN